MNGKGGMRKMRETSDHRGVQTWSHLSDRWQADWVGAHVER